LNGLLINSVSQSVIGRKVSIGAVWRESKGQLLRLIGLTILTGIIYMAVAIAMLLAVSVIAAPFLTVSDSSGAVFAAIMVFLVMLGGVGVLLFVYTRLSVASPALMMEKIGVGTAIARSWRLTKGFVLRNFGVLLLAIVIAGVISGVASIPIGFISGLLIQSLGPNSWAAIAIPTFLTGLLTALITPFLAAVTSLLYVDLRMRKEGLDVALIRSTGAGQ
nr:hypothetical protein [Actinomycetales bacterium]